MGRAAVAADHDRVDLAEILQQSDLRATLAQVKARQPRALADRPGAGGVLVDDVVSQPQLRKSLPGAHQIAADRLPGADDIAQRLLPAARDPDRVQAVDRQQPQHPLSIGGVADAVAGWRGAAAPTRGGDVQPDLGSRGHRTTPDD